MRVSVGEAERASERRRQARGDERLNPGAAQAARIQACHRVAVPFGGSGGHRSAGPPCTSPRRRARQDRGGGANEIESERRQEKDSESERATEVDAEA